MFQPCIDLTMDSEDELDLISDGARTLVANTPAPSTTSTESVTSVGSDRTLRPRESMGTPIYTTETSKRKRKESLSNVENVVFSSKKTKVQGTQLKLTMDSKKAVRLT